MPSVEGGGLDEGHSATLRGEVHHVDEILRAESDYLDQWDVEEVSHHPVAQDEEISGARQSCLLNCC